MMTGIKKNIVKEEKQVSAYNDAHKKTITKNKP